MDERMMIVILSHRRMHSKKKRKLFETFCAFFSTVMPNSACILILISAESIFVCTAALLRPGCNPFQSSSSTVLLIHRLLWYFHTHFHSNNVGRSTMAYYVEMFDKYNHAEWFQAGPQHWGRLLRYWKKYFNCRVIQIQCSVAELE